MLTSQDVWCIMWHRKLWVLSPTYTISINSKLYASSWKGGKSLRKKEFSVVICGGQSNFVISFCLNQVQQLAHVYISVLLSASMGEMGQVIQGQGTSWEIRCSATQKSRWALVFLHVLYVSKEQDLLASNKRSQRSGSRPPHREWSIYMVSIELFWHLLVLLHNIDISH